MIIDEIAFRGLLNKGESIRYVGHVHPFTIYPKLFKNLVFGVLLPIGGYFLFPPFVVVWAAWLILGTLLFTYRIIQWYMDAWIVTNFGVIDQQWNSFFNKNTTRIEFGNIEGVSHEIKGFWGTILRFGFIQIEHMSGEPFILSNVASPRKIEREIVKCQQDYVQKQTMEDHSKLKDLLTGLVRSANK